MNTGTNAKEKGESGAHANCGAYDRCIVNTSTDTKENYEYRAHVKNCATKDYNGPLHQGSGVVCAQQRHHSSSHYNCSCSGSTRASGGGRAQPRPAMGRCTKAAALQLDGDVL